MRSWNLSLAYDAVVFSTFILLTFQAASAAQSQLAAPSARVLVLPHPRTILLRSGAIHTELGLEQEQVDSILTVVEKVERPLWRLRDVSPDKRDALARPFLDQLEEHLSATLSAKQIRRFDQITLQGLGIAGLLDSQVAARLRLSQGQLEVLASRLSTQRQGRGQEWNVRNILSDRQIRVLASLKGPAFDLSRVRQRACRAPELRDIAAWINSELLTLAQMRGRVVVVHFYAFGCIKCVRNLPHYNGWSRDFPSDRVKIVGIHRPETESERVIESVRQKAAQAGMMYPIAIDNQGRNWDAWGNRVWPSVYLIDKYGFVRYWWYGELNWQGAEGEKWMRSKIQELSSESMSAP